LNNQILPQWLGFFEKRVGSNGFAVGESLTIADLKLYGAFIGILINAPFFKGITSSIFDKAPNVLKIVNNVKKHPKVNQWNNTINKFLGLDYN
jgi:glutathione S-transferase